MAATRAQLPCTDPLAFDQQLLGAQTPTDWLYDRCLVDPPCAAAYQLVDAHGTPLSGGRTAFAPDFDRLGRNLRRRSVPERAPGVRGSRGR